MTAKREPTKFVLLGTLSYLLVTFPLAILWHLFLFKDLYERIGYIGREEPGFFLGFLAILIQGLVLTYGYLILHAHLYGAVRYAAVAGLFFWTGHVLAAAAKQPLANVPLFFGMETIYLALQFGIYGLLLSWLDRIVK